MIFILEASKNGIDTWKSEYFGCIDLYYNSSIVLLERESKPILRRYNIIIEYIFLQKSRYYFFLSSLRLRDCRASLCMVSWKSISLCTSTDWVYCGSENSFWIYSPSHLWWKLISERVFAESFPVFWVKFSIIFSWNGSRVIASAVTSITGSVVTDRSFFFGFVSASNICDFFLRVLSSCSDIIRFVSFWIDCWRGAYAGVVAIDIPAAAVRRVCCKEFIEI